MRERFRYSRSGEPNANTTTTKHQQSEPQPSPDSNNGTSMSHYQQQYMPSSPAHPPPSGNNYATEPETTPMMVIVDDADVAAGNTNTISSKTSVRSSSKDKQLLFEGHGHSSAESSNGATRKQQNLKNKGGGDGMMEGPSSSAYNSNGGAVNSRFGGVAVPPRSAANSVASLNTAASLYPSDLGFSEDVVPEPVLVLGVDISHLDRNSQFFVCAAGVFGFSLLYGYLQELISVKICARKLGLFLAMVQFSGYTILAYVLRTLVHAKEQRRLRRKQRGYDGKEYDKKHDDSSEGPPNLLAEARKELSSINPQKVLTSPATVLSVPLFLYLGLSILRAIDLGMTNMAMQYINYPAKTLMKSSRVVFTMLFGVVISRKKYKLVDYAIVFAMVAGLALFMHADAKSSAVFDLAGVLMLTVSLVCDGAISNVSESIMSKFRVGQDEFIFRVYSIALVAITFAAILRGDFVEGFLWLMQPGAYDELDKPIEERTWTVMGKITVIILFSSMGFFGSSCSAAITKNFGALTMSITSTARKAATLFLSFFLFNNVCTFEHILGVIVFITALTAKSLRRKGDSTSGAKQVSKSKSRKGPSRSYSNSSASSMPSIISDVSDVEMANNHEAAESNIPVVVHTDTLRSRTASSPKNKHSLVTTL